VEYASVAKKHAMSLKRDNVRQKLLLITETCIDAFDWYRNQRP